MIQTFFKNLKRIIIFCFTTTIGILFFFLMIVLLIFPLIFFGKHVVFSFWNNTTKASVFFSFPFQNLLASIGYTISFFVLGVFILITFQTLISVLLKKEINVNNAVIILAKLLPLIFLITTSFYLTPIQFGLLTSFFSFVGITAYWIKLFPNNPKIPKTNIHNDKSEDDTI